MIMNIHHNLLGVKPSTTVAEARELLARYAVSSLPISEEGQFVGMLSAEVLSEAPAQALLSDYTDDLECYFVRESLQWDKVLELFAPYDTNIVPVLDEQHNYIGYYHLPDFAQELMDTPFMKEKGQFLLLQKSAESYSFSEISQIVESHSGKLLGLFISEATEEGDVHITLKVISDHISAILQSFRRYGYGILLEKEDDLYWQNLKDTSAYFERYLSV